MIYDFFHIIMNITEHEIRRLRTITMMLAEYVQEIEPCRKKLEKLEKILKDVDNCSRCGYSENCENSHGSYVTCNSCFNMSCYICEWCLHYCDERERHAVCHNYDNHEDYETIWYCDNCSVPEICPQCNKPMHGL